MSSDNTTLSNVTTMTVTATKSLTPSKKTVSSTPEPYNSTYTSITSQTNGFTNITTIQMVTDLNTTVNWSPNGTTPHDLTVPTSATTGLTLITQGKMSTTTVLQANGENDLSRNPGLVAVLCIFCIVLGLLAVVTIAKVISSRRNKFERLEDVPMGKMNEESPFAHY